MTMCLKISAMGKIYLNLHKYIVSRGHGGNAQFQFSFFVLVIEADCKSPYSVRVTKICVPKNPTVLYLPVLYSIGLTVHLILWGGGEGGSNHHFSSR